MYSGDPSVVDGGVIAAPTSVAGGEADTSSTSFPVTYLTVSDSSDVLDAPISPVSLRLSTIDEPVITVTHRDAWHRRYAVELVAIDLIAGMFAVATSLLLRAVLPRYSTAHDDPVVLISFAIALPITWVALVGLNRAYQSRFVGVGPTEFQLVFRAFWQLAGVVAFVAFAAKAESARAVILGALPLTLAVDLVGRYLARKRLHNRRLKGRSMTSVVAVGGAASVAEFTAMVRHDRHAGMHVVGACLPTEQLVDSDTAKTLEDLGVPILGDVDSVLQAVHASGAHTVAVLSGEVSADKLRWVSWQLEGTDTDLVVSPGLTEVAGTRLHIQPVAGLPLLHVEEPEFSGVRRVVKGLIDRIAAVIGLVALAPLFVVLAIMIRCGSRGPVFFKQTRVGRDGRVFRMIKFRSMYSDAESRLAELMMHNESDGLLFKMKDDPRVTRVGRMLRRTSLDELPQLINVLMGTMSLVGPRPPLPKEVAAYGDDVRRRLLVKPGVTGLWQVSGRSNLSWDETVRLDLRYVENWSFTLDLMILWKTVFAVTRGSGAY
jgi:exopolysaccharide biosynthesis polyprenyl glycosylphosphotransferase